MNYTEWKNGKEEHIQNSEFVQPSDMDTSPVAYVKELYPDDYYSLLEWNDSLKFKMTIRELSLDNLIALIMYVSGK